MREIAGLKGIKSLIFCFVPCFLVFCGCGGRSDIATVTGTVTLEGQPLANARIVFQPMGSGSASYGRTDAEGKYELQYGEDIMGATIGSHRVTISTFSAGDPDADPPDAITPELVPSKYNAETELHVEVSRGENTLNFDLEPGPLPDWQAYSRGDLGSDEEEQEEEE